MSHLRRRASARKRESRATVSRVQNPVPRVGLRETPVQRGVRQAVRRLSKGASRFSIRTTRIVRGVRTDGIARTDASRARGTRALPLPTKLNFSIFSIFFFPVDRDPTRTQCAAQCKCVGGRNDVPHEHGTHVAHPQARGGERRARTRTAGARSRAARARWLGAPPERERPRAMRGGHGGQLTPRIRHARRRVVPKRARRPGMVVPAPRPRALRAGAGRRRVDGGAAAPEAGAGRARRGGVSRRRPPAARAFTLAATPTVAIPRFDRHRPNTFCRQMTCSTGRTCSCASPWRRWATGTSTRRASRIRSRTPRRRRARRRSVRRRY